MQPRILAASRSRVECELVENHPLRLVGARGRRVQCMEGVVWITAYNHAHDIFLHPGDEFVIPNGRLVLAEAIGACRIQVELPRAFDYDKYRPRWPVAIRRAWRGLQLSLKSAVRS